MAKAHMDDAINPKRTALKQDQRKKKKECEAEKTSKIVNEFS